MPYQLIAIICIFVTVTAFVRWLYELAGQINASRVRKRLTDLAPQAGVPLSQERTGSLAMLAPMGNALAKPFLPKTRNVQSRLRHQLGHAGFYAHSAAPLFIGTRVLLLFLGAITGMGLGIKVAASHPLIADPPWLLFFAGTSFGGLIGYILPSIWLKLRTNAYRQSLERGLPDTLDLMVICMEAGLTIDAAMQYVGRELGLAHPNMARELEMTHTEMQVGVSRADALRNLGQRSGLDSIQGLVAMLVQASRFGTSIANALRIYTESLRTKRQNSAEEMAAKTSVKLTFPVVLFLFPVILIVLIAPAIIKMMGSSFFVD